jgi:hypothetical protein
MLATRARDSLPQTPSSGERFGHVVAVIAAGGALAGWIAVVGAVREYARFSDAGIPSPAQTASLFPREALLGEGLTTVAPIIGIASGRTAHPACVVGQYGIVASPVVSGFFSALDS